MKLFLFTEKMSIRLIILGKALSNLFTGNAFHTVHPGSSLAITASPSGLAVFAWVQVVPSGHESYSWDKWTITFDGLNPSKAYLNGKETPNLDTDHD